jgi:uncharacterized protein YegL
LVLVMSLVVIMAGALAGTSAAEAGTVTGSKTLDQTAIACAGTANVTITLTGESSIVGTPQDVVLVLDRSGSMAGTRLADLKTAANGLIDRLDLETDGVADGTIANGSRVGVVSFADTATTNVALTADAAAAKAAVTGLTASGGTNHGDAIILAQSLFGANGKNMVIVTDGATTTGPDPSAAAANARAAGTTVFTIGLGITNTSAEWAALRDWAADPAGGTRAFLAPTSTELDTIFDTIGAAIAAPAATGVSVTDTLGADFDVLGAPTATKGSVVVNASGNVVWSGFDLGSEQATLTYTAKHVGTLGDLKQVSTVSYSDDQGRSAGDVGLTDSQVFVSCSTADAFDECTGGNCTTNGSLLSGGLGITSTASGFGSTAATSLAATSASLYLVQRSLGNTPAPCAGFTSLIGAPGVEVYTTDQVPDVMSIRFVISKEVRKQYGIGVGHLRMCLETNLPFKMDNGKISPKVSTSPDRYAGLLPKKATKTNVAGYGLINSPYVKFNGLAGGQAEGVVFVFTPYDPRATCC